MSGNTCQCTIHLKHGGSLRHADWHTHARSAVCFLCGSRWLWGPCVCVSVGRGVVLAHFGVSVLGPPGTSSLGLIQVTLGTWAKEALIHKIFPE